MHLKILILAALTFTVVFSHAASSWAEEVKTGVFTDTFQGRPYAICIPRSYKGKAEAKKWPLIVGLHWHHGSGKELLELFKNHLRYGSFIMACPDGTDEAWASKDEGLVLALIEDFKGKYEIDPDHVFLMGLSAGAHFTYHVGLMHPEVFRAIAVYAGDLATAQIRFETRIAREKKRQIPVFIMHGELDKLVPLWHAKWSRDTLQKYGHEVTYETIPWQDHSFPPGKVYPFLEWFGKIVSSDTIPVESLEKQ